MKVTPYMAAEMRRRFSAGESIKSISLAFEVSWQTVQYNIRDEWKEVQKERVKKCQRKAKERAKPVEEILAPPPPDPRDLTARVCGDPLPGRSALDQRARSAPPVAVAYGTVEL